MKRLFVFLALFFITCYLSLSKGAGSESFFPEIEGWRLTVTERVYGPSDLWDIIDGAADTYLGYSFLDLHLADYENDEGINVRVELYRHTSFDNSFGIYTAERSPDYHFIDIGSQGYIEQGVLNFLCGYYYVKMTCLNQGDKVQNSLIEIARNIDKNLKQDKNWPEILQLFPPGKLLNSERYFSENFLGLEFLHSAFTADYSREDGDFQVFIIRKENPIEAREMLREYLAFTKQDLEISDGQFKIHDPYNGDIDIILKGNTMAGIVNCEVESTRTEFLEILKEKL
jgi:Family of unknown function (DUF6599)